MATYGGLEPEALDALKDMTEEEAERALLARFLFSPPPRQVVAGERNGLVLDRVLRQLQALLRMLSGRPLRLAYSDPSATDNHNVYLPRALPAPDSDADLLIYRVMGLVQVGFMLHDILKERPILAEIHRDWVLRSSYHLLATRFVLRKWAEDFPGLKEDIERVAWLDKAGIMRVNVTEVPRDGMPGPFIPLYEGLANCLNWKKPGSDGDPARAAVSIVDGWRGPVNTDLLISQSRRLRDHFRRLKLGPPPLPFFVGIIRPEWILAELSRDIAYENEWKKGNKPLRQLMDAIARKGGLPGGPPPPPDAKKPSLKDRLLGKLMGPDMSKAPAYGALRDEYVEKKQKEASQQQAKWAPGMDAEAMLVDAVRPEEDGIAYDEWDEKAGIYRVAATKIFEIESPTGGLDGYQKIVEANRRQIKEIRRRFEALRMEERWLHGQRDGAELDLNRTVMAVCDIASGQNPDDRIYKRFQRQRQTVSILTMVDVSGSTQGKVLHVEQEAIVLFAEGLKTLGLPHAFYGFSNNHAMECNFQRIKGFDEVYTEPVFKRLGNLRAGGATRMGTFIRHAGKVLTQRPQARRILMILSDGKPEDRGDYRGNYGIKDTAMAVQEVRRAGVHVHCISVDPAEDAEKYLDTIFGRASYLKLRDVDSLPARLPEVFRKLIK